MLYLDVLGMGRGLDLSFFALFRSSLCSLSVSSSYCCCSLQLSVKVREASFLIEVAASRVGSIFSRHTISAPGVTWFVVPGVAAEIPGEQLFMPFCVVSGEAPLAYTGQGEVLELVAVEEA